MTVEFFEPGRHLRRVSEIERDSFGKDAWPTDLFRQYAADARTIFLVARLGRTTTGYVIAVRRPDRCIEIESLAVHSRYRRTGVATVLFDQVARRALIENTRWIGLMVRRDNQGAIRFYRELGFVRTATVAGYYEDGCAGWRMRLKLR